MTDTDEPADFDDADHDDLDDLDYVDEGDDDEGDDDDFEAAESAAPAGAAPRARAVLEHTVKAVVSQPDVVTIEESRGRSGSVALDVSVAPGDMGRVIGKRGRVAHAIRAVVRAAAVKDGVSVEVEFVE
ncbi:MAG: KH domain-containing protein [Acidimicrobiales bacterium]